MNRNKKVLSVLVGLGSLLLAPIAFCQTNDTVLISPPIIPVEQSSQPDLSKQSPEVSPDIAQDPFKQKFSMELKEMDIRELLKILSVKTGLTIISTKEVNGRLSVFINDTTVRDVFSIACAVLNLAYIKELNIITFMTAAEYQGRYGKDFNEKRRVKTIKFSYADPAKLLSVLNEVKSSVGKVIVDEASGTLLLFDTPEKNALMIDVVEEMDSSAQSESFDINYADITKVKDYLSGFLTPAAGKITVDERSHKIIVTDLPQRLKNIRKLVALIDEESRQVLIEGRIVQINLSGQHANGIEWENILKKVHNLDFKGSFPASNLSAYGKISVGTLDSDDYAAVFSILEQLGKTQIISTPRITTLNNVQAKILVGSREAYITQTLSQAQTTTVTSEAIQFVDVGVKLDLTPVIGADGFITIKIKPEISSVRQTLTTASGSVVPIIETSEAETTVKVKDGVTIMLAGLIKDDSRSVTSGIPVLSKIPFLGKLFRSDKKEKNQSELVVFLTPRIIRGDVFLDGKVSAFDSEIKKEIPRNTTSIGPDKETTSPIKNIKK